jgi:hypothetical protein
MTPIEALQLLDVAPMSHEEWNRYFEAYGTLYGIDAAPFWAHRPEDWRFHQGVEIEQYDNGH